jgi:hypothetical protein
LLALACDGMEPLVLNAQALAYGGLRFLGARQLLLRLDQTLPVGGMRIPRGLRLLVLRGQLMMELVFLAVGLLLLNSGFVLFVLKLLRLIMLLLLKLLNFGLIRVKFRIVLMQLLCLGLLFCLGLLRFPLLLGGLLLSMLLLVAGLLLLTLKLLFVSLLLLGLKLFFVTLLVLRLFLLLLLLLLLLSSPPFFFFLLLLGRLSLGENNRLLSAHAARCNSECRYAR